MSIFTVLEAPDGKEDRVVFIKEGFAPWALILTVVWALWHRMWVIAAVLFVLFVGLNLAVSQGGLDGTLAGFIELAIGFVFGLEARRLQVLSLERTGYRNAGLVEASALQAAELKYFTRRTVNTPKLTATPYRPHADDMLNLFGSV